MLIAQVNFFSRHKDNPQNSCVLGILANGSSCRNGEDERKWMSSELQRIIDTANAPVFGVDANFCIDQWNSMATLTSGFSREEVMGRCPLQVYIHFFWFR
jgi:hypothetical protein